jgi:hypothetical protein
MAPLNINENESVTQGPGNVVIGDDSEGNYLGVDNPPGKDVRWNHWGLAQDMNLRRTCADFYLLYDLNLEDKDEGRFQQLMDWIIPQFVRYTDMAVGGELRHARYKLKSGAKSLLPLPLRRALSDGTLPSQRHSAWHNWKFFRNAYGSVALRWAEACFNSFSGGGYGGPRWANIAKVLRMYETGELTPISFIDTCWGLEHNGGAYFNKAWNTSGMKHVLDSALHENLTEVRHAASPSVRQLHEQHGSL